MANTARIQQDILHLKQISSPCEAGVTRIGFTPEYRQGADYIKAQMRQAGLKVREDSVGNIYGRLNGTLPNAPAILSGSHLDTVRCAGAYDGIAGVACALEAARMLRERGKPLRHPYEVIGTIEEEGTRFGQVLLGSRYLAGKLDRAQTAAFRDDDGRAMEDVLREYLPATVCPAYREDQDILAFLELHDEQGPLLEHEGIPIGIVEAIVAICHLTVTVTGFAGHAGTVPMALRRDAGAGAFRLIDRLAHHVTDQYGTCATLTVGKLELLPGSANGIPSGCIFSIDLRAGAYETLQELLELIREQAGQISRECRVEIHIRQDSLQRPVSMHPRLQEIIEKSCRLLGHSSMRLDSGAGHDAMILAERWDTAMIFVPCDRGITHHPDEYVSPQALAIGADVLLQTILQLDEE